MNHKNLILDKLKNITNFNEYEILEIFRENKKTLIKFKCKKCNTIFVKEQYALINKTKKILCNKCYNISIEKITIEKINNLIKKSNVQLIKTFRNKASVVMIEYICKCGNHNISQYNKNKLLRCATCANKEKNISNKRDYNDFIKLIKLNNCKPLFTKNDYKNSNTSLLIQCKCGNIFSTRYSHYIKKQNLRCRRCMCEENSGENHWRWKGGIKRRFENEEHWERKIKRLFNYTCCISGCKERKNLVAHHLNCFNSYPQQKLDLINGVCITKELHKEFHSLYDKYKGNCKREEFEEFFKNKTGKEFNDFLKNNIIYPI